MLEKIETYKQIKNELSNAGVKFPAFEAFVLFEEIIGKKYINALDEDITIEKIEKLSECLKKRKKGYPLQYIVENWSFWGMNFKIGEGVLIPRSDTEILVEVVIEKIKTINSPIIFDLCSGSGCIAISLAKERPDSTIYAIEKSEIAFEYIKKNIELNVVKNVIPILGDVCNPNFINVDIKSNLILSNPPYIKSKDLNSLQKEVQFEPPIALDGGRDGLNFYRKITKLWVSKLKPNGTLAFEIGINQLEEVKNIMKQNNLKNITAKKDFNGIYRVLTGENK